jgi:hypothetical protein
MAKLNTPARHPATRSPITTAPTATTTTAEGAPGWERDPKSELFLLAVSHMVGEDKFYETAQDADDRYVALVRANAAEDPTWTAGFLRWLRAEGNMRTASIVGGAEYAHATKGMPLEGRPTGRSVVSSVLRRPDEPGEMLAYWTGKYGRVIPKPVKRGVADAIVRMSDERAFLKWDSAARGFRMGGRDRPRAPGAEGTVAVRPVPAHDRRPARARRQHPGVATCGTCTGRTVPACA